MFFSKKIIVLLFLIPLSLFAQRYVRPRYAPRGVRNEFNALNQKQGNWKTYNAMGELMIETEYVNDKMEGTFRKFYPEERVMEQIEYFAGRKDGEYKKFFFSGTVAQEGTYKKGKKDGKWIRYYDNEQIRTEGNYTQNSMDGEWDYCSKIFEKQKSGGRTSWESRKWICRHGR